MKDTSFLLLCACTVKRQLHSHTACTGCDLQPLREWHHGTKRAPCCWESPVIVPQPPLHEPVTGFDAIHHSFATGFFSPGNP